MRKAKAGIIVFAALFAALLWSCEKDDDIVAEELTKGYWMETVTEGMLLRFDNTGDVFKYIYRYHQTESIYYGYLDPAWSQNDKYLLDDDNGLLFIKPDKWYHLLRLTSTEMTIDDGENKHSFVKLKSKEINIVTRNEFGQIFPD